MDRPDEFGLDTLRMRTSLRRKVKSIPLPARLAMAILLAQPTITKAEDIFDGGTDERIADVSIRLDSDVTLSIDIDIDTSALTSFLKKFPADLVLEIPKVLRRANKEFLISQLEAHELTIPLDTNKFRENEKMAGDVEAVRLVWNRHVREMEKNGKISGRTSKFFQFDDIYSFAAFVNMFVGHAPEGDVPPESPEDNPVIDEEPEVRVTVEDVERADRERAEREAHVYETYTPPEIPALDPGQELDTTKLSDEGYERILRIAEWLNEDEVDGSENVIATADEKRSIITRELRNYKIEKALPPNATNERSEWHKTLESFKDDYWNKKFPESYKNGIQLRTLEEARLVINMLCGVYPGDDPWQDRLDARREWEERDAARDKTYRDARQARQEAEAAAAAELERQRRAEEAKKDK